jgi:hypothetical protein
MTPKTVPEDLTVSFLCCLPKKPAGRDAEFVEYLTPDCTRPLSVGNTDARIIANAYRGMLERIAKELVANMQQGFLTGRSLLRNVLDIDFESMRVSLTCHRGALVLFDFESAFPSISRTYLFRTLNEVGLPVGVINMVEALYRKNACVIEVKCSSYKSFQMSSGVRQGCPLSPLLFVIAVDLLLRRLA